MNPNVFISYRRDDSEDMAARIRDHLEQLLGRGQVFRDVDNISLGVRFAEHLNSALENCGVVLVVIGSRWLSPRLQEPIDYVRMEIEHALRRRIAIIPVLVGGSTMPHRSALPASIRDLVAYNGTSVKSDGSFRATIENLANNIQTKLAEHRELQARIPAGVEDAAQVPNAGELEVELTWLNRIAFKRSTFAIQTVAYGLCVSVIIVISYFHLKALFQNADSSVTPLLAYAALYLLFGIGWGRLAIESARTALTSKPALILSEAGIDNTCMKHGTLTPWPEIEKCYTRGNKLFVEKAQLTAPTSSRSSSLVSRVLAQTRFQIVSLDELATDAKTVNRLITAYQRHFGAPREHSRHTQ